MPLYRQETEFRSYGYVEVEAENAEAASEIVYYMSDEAKSDNFVQTGAWWTDAEEVAYEVTE